jgi:hypothetical protein
MMRRRHALSALAGGWIGVPTLAVPGPRVLQPVALPEPMAQIA